MADPSETVAYGTWLSGSLLFLVGSPPVEPGESRAVLLAGEHPVDVAVRCIALRSPNGGPRKVVTAAVQDGATVDRGARPVSIAAAPRTEDSPSAEVRLTGLKEILDERLSGLETAAAGRVLEFVSAAPSAHGLADEPDLVLSSRLHALRNALRQHLPTVAVERDQPLTGNVDELIAIDDRSFFVKGWLRDGEAQLASFTAMSPEGEVIPLLGRVVRPELPEFEIFAGGPYSEPIDASWFVGWFETQRPSRLRREWVFEVRNETGRGVEMRVLPTVIDARAARTRVLQSVPERFLPDERLMSEHLFPAISRLQEKLSSSTRIERVTGYGAAAESPEVSIVVPLYERIDLLEHHLLHFNSDPEIRAQDLIYVLDSPELDTALAEQARQLSRLYDVPFRIATMAENSGFGAATNAGVSIARADLVLLLNSDVLPAEPGWLGRLKAFQESTPNIGALGPKLLYEDDSLQHAGLYFETIGEGPTAGSWANLHYYKGLHKDLPAANIARPVPAVTAACLMIDKQLYQQVGGLPDVYVQGDYEDSELCVRLVEAGHENWYLPEVELYHLEGSSYSPAERDITGSYNRWLQTRRCGQAIADVMARYPQA